MCDTYDRISKYCKSLKVQVYSLVKPCSETFYRHLMFACFKCFLYAVLSVVPKNGKDHPKILLPLLLVNDRCLLDLAFSLLYHYGA